TLYDAQSNIRFVLRPNSEVPAGSTRVEHTYNGLNQRWTSYDQRDGLTTLVYDAAGRVFQFSDQVGNRTSDHYNALRHRTTVTRPDVLSQQFAYDPLGNLLSKTDRLGRERVFRSDALGRSLGETWLTPDEATVVGLSTLTYDAGDNLLSAANSAGGFT